MAVVEDFYPVFEFTIFEIEVKLETRTLHIKIYVYNLLNSKFLTAETQGLKQNKTHED